MQCDSTLFLFLKIKKGIIALGTAQMYIYFMTHFPQAIQGNTQSITF